MTDPAPLFDAGDRFEVRRVIGEGGVGVVYEAYDRELEELVALKTLLNPDGRWLASFKQEFRFLHDLAHPNLVSLGELFDGETEPFFTMELVRGFPFLDYVWRLPPELAPGASGTNPHGRRRGPPTPQTVDATGDSLAAAAPATLPSSAELPGASAPTGSSVSPVRRPPEVDDARLRESLRQLARAIATLHGASKVHRDIKPSNVMVTEQGRVVLLDFGLVAEVAAPQQAPDGRVVGTVFYMAPEQGAVGSVNPASDWYSLGVLLYEALTGAVPHCGDNLPQVLIDKQTVPVERPGAHVPAVPADLDHLCASLLSMAPEQRPTASEIFAVLGQRMPERQRITGEWPSEGSGGHFVGRVAPLSALERAYQGVKNGPHMVVVEGSSGVGKTHLVEHFLRQLPAEDEVMVLSGRCYEREVVPFKAFDGIADALASQLARLGRVEQARFLPRYPALLGRLFPVLKRVAAVAAAEVVRDVPDPQDQRRRMFGALRELFLRLSEKYRLVWFIDDLQWTDADSLVLLGELIAHEEPLPVLILATMRPEEEQGRRGLMRRLRQLAPFERISLDLLSPAEAGQLALQLVPGARTEIHDAIATEAGGHPLLLRELARHAEISAETLGEGATLEDMLDVRLEELESAARDLLEVAAVAGEPLDHEVAALAAGLTGGSEARVVRTLRAEHLVRTDGVRKRDRLLPYHDRVREHVYARLSPSRRQHLHERIAVALEQCGAAERNPRALVRHAKAAGRNELAALYAETAAHHAESALAFDQAAEHFQVALELGDHDESTRRALQGELAAALMHAGRGPEAAAVFLAAAEGADPATRLDCQRQAAEQWIITGHLEQGMATLQISLEEIGEPAAASPRAAMARVLWNRARLRLRGMGVTERRASQVPVETLRRLDVLKAVAHGLAMVDNVRGADFNGRYLLLALRTGEARRLVGALGTEIVFLASQGGRAGERARRLTPLLQRIAQRCDDRSYGETWLHLSEGASRFFEGRFRASLEAFQQVEAIFAGGPAGLTYEKNNARVFRVHTLRLLGDIRGHGALIAGQVRAGQQRGDRYLVTTLQSLRDLAFLAADEPAEVRRSLGEASWTPPEDGFHLQHWYDLRAQVELSLYEGNAVAAEKVLASTFEAMRRSMLLRVQLVRCDATALHARLHLAAAVAEGDPARARTQVGAAVRRLRREGVGYATVYADLLRAGMAAMEQRTEEAITHLRAAAQEAARDEMALHAAAAHYRLACLLGGEDGRDAQEAAHQYARAQGVVQPDRYFGMIAPGWPAGG